MTAPMASGPSPQESYELIAQLAHRSSAIEHILASSDLDRWIGFDGAFFGGLHDVLVNLEGLNEQLLLKDSPEFRGSDGLPSDAGTPCPRCGESAVAGEVSPSSPAIKNVLRIEADLGGLVEVMGRAVRDAQRFQGGE